MKHVKWFVAAALVGTLFYGCKAKEQTAEAPPPEQPKAEAPAQPKAETPAPLPAQPKAEAPAPAQPTAMASAPVEAPRKGFDRALLRPSALKEQAPETFQVKFTTTRGDFVVTVTRAWAPLGADRFYNLVKHHFFDNASFFRVHPAFIVQFGISAYPPVSAAWDNATIKDDPVKESNKRGSLTFATAGPGTRTTQLFINFGDNSRLDRMGFSPFGQVTEGMNVVEMFYEGYGEIPAMGGSGPEPSEIEKQGKAYLDKSFPKLDFIKSTTLIGPASGGAKP
jgi:peptidyl-prolyl cis-trans isomerase A (cyclophilin A)